MPETVGWEPPSTIDARKVAVQTAPRSMALAFRERDLCADSGDSHESTQTVNRRIRRAVTRFGFGAIARRRRQRPGRPRQVHELVRSQGAAAARNRRRDAALVLVQRRGKNVPRRAGAGPVMHHRELGHRGDPDVESARRPGRIPQRCGSRAGRNRSGPPRPAQDPARARLHRGGRRVLPGFFDPLRTLAPGVARQGIRSARRPLPG